MNDSRTVERGQRFAQAFRRANTYVSQMQRGQTGTRFVVRSKSTDARHFSVVRTGSTVVTEEAAMAEDRS